MTLSGTKRTTGREGEDRDTVAASVPPRWLCPGLTLNTAVASSMKTYEGPVYLDFKGA